MNQTRNYHLVNIYRTTLVGQTHLIYDESDLNSKEFKSNTLATMYGSKFGQEQEYIDPYTLILITVEGRMQRILLGCFLSNFL